MTDLQNRMIDSKLSGHDKERILRGRKLFKRSLIITAVLALIIAAGLAISLFYTDIETIDQFMSDSRPWLGYWRLLLFLTVFGGWDYWSRLYARWSLMSAEQLERMIGFRWRMAAWVLVMEAVFAQHVLSDFVNNVL